MIYDYNVGTHTFGPETPIDYATVQIDFMEEMEAHAMDHEDMRLFCAKHNCDCLIHDEGLIIYDPETEL